MLNVSCEKTQTTVNYTSYEAQVSSCGWSEQNHIQGKPNSMLLIALKRTYQLNGQLPDNPSCKDASSRQPASFCLKTEREKKKGDQLFRNNHYNISVSTKDQGFHFKSTDELLQSYVCRKTYSSICAQSIFCS